MRPLSPRKRFAYLSLLSLLFFISVPIALMYATGYRYKAGFGIVKTGGVYLSIPYPDATIRIDGKEVGRTGLLNRNAYIDDLAPSAYELRVTREGYLLWSRTLIVEPQIVTEADVVLLPEELERIKLTRGGTTTATTRALTPREYEAYLAAFEVAATSTHKSGNGERGEVVFVEKGNVSVRWMSEERVPPSNFCVRPSYCSREILIEKGSERTISALWFGGGVVYATRESGVFFSEADVRPTPLSTPLYEKAHADARVIGGKLIVKDGSTLYELVI